MIQRAFEKRTGIMDGYLEAFEQIRVVGEAVRQIASEAVGRNPNRLECNFRVLSIGRPGTPPAGFEPATCALGKRCSIQLS
jgi:hypothetical protein